MKAQVLPCGERAVLVEFGGKPGGSAKRIEEADNGNRIRLSFALCLRRRRHHARASHSMKPPTISTGNKPAATRIR